jgi:hypothetical protein
VWLLFKPFVPAPTDAMFSAFVCDDTCDINTRPANGWDALTLWLSIGLTMPNTRDQTLKDLEEVYFLSLKELAGWNACKDVDALVVDYVGRGFYVPTHLHVIAHACAHGPHVTHTLNTHVPLR